MAVRIRNTVLASMYDLDSLGYTAPRGRLIQGGEEPERLGLRRVWDSHDYGGIVLSPRSEMKQPDRPVQRRYARLPTPQGATEGPSKDGQ